jgi:hypothetical protein
MRRGVHPSKKSDGLQLLRCLSGGLSLATGNEEAEVFFHPPGALLKGTADGGDHSTRVPIKTQDTTERLKPTGIHHSRKNFARAILLDDHQNDFPAQPVYSVKKPLEGLAAVQR